MDSGDAPHFLLAEEYATELIEYRPDNGMTEWDQVARKRAGQADDRSLELGSTLRSNSSHWLSYP